jgi:hypothetical protein
MSLVGHRNAIAAALSTVPGVTGYPYRPTTPKAGDGWPLWSASDRSEGWAFINTWRVLVALPSDERQASAWVDEHQEALVDAMQGQDVGYVDRLEPVGISTSAGDQLALQIVMRSE